MKAVGAGPQSAAKSSPGTDDNAFIGNSGNSGLGEQLASLLASLEPEAEVLDKPVDAVVRIYVTLFELLMEKMAIGDLNKALNSQHAYNKLHRCSLRDVKQSHRQRTAVCGTAVKVLAWTWFRANGLSKADKDEAVDVLMEVFFDCEREGTKAVQSTAQLCVWALSSVGGKFPTDRGRFKRVLEVARLSNCGNAWNSERIQTESCRLLKTLALNNLDTLAFHSVDWIIPIVKSLAHKSDKLRTLALEALLAGLNCIWNSLEAIRTSFSSDESAAWQPLEICFKDCVKTSPGSPGRIHVASCYGIILFLFHGYLCEDLQRLNSALEVANNLLAQASPERLLLLRQWRFVVEAFCESDAAVLASVKKLQMPMRNIMREGHEPEAKVRREAFITWSHLASIALATHARLQAQESRDMLRDLFRVLVRALGDIDAQVRGPAVEFSVQLIRAAQAQTERSFADEEYTLLSRQNSLLESKIFFPPHYASFASMSFPETVDLCQLIDATLKEHQDLGEERVLALFRETTPIWSCALSCRMSSMKRQSTIANGFADRTLASLRTLHRESISLVLTQLQCDLAENTSLALLVPRVHIALCVVDASEEAIFASGGVLASGSIFGTVFNWLFPDGEVRPHAVFTSDCQGPLKLWTIVALHLTHENASGSVQAWLGAIFERAHTFEEPNDSWKNLASQTFENLINYSNVPAVIQIITGIDASVNAFTPFSMQCFASVCKGALESSEESILQISEYLGLVLNRDERLGIAPSKRTLLGTFMDCARSLIERVPIDVLGRVLELLFVAPCENLLVHVFATAVVPRMQTGFSWNVYAHVVELALRSADRSVKSIACAVCDSHEVGMPETFKHFLNRKMPDAITPRSTGSKRSPPTSSSSYTGGKPQIGGIAPLEFVPSEQKKRPRQVETKDRISIGVATYTNLDPSQLPMDSEDVPTVIVGESERVLTTTQDAPSLHPVETLIQDIRRLGDSVRSIDLPLSMQETFKAAALGLIKDLFDAASKHPSQ